jgi:hypothetical protein
MSPATATGLDPAAVISSMTSDPSSAAAMSLTTMVAPDRADRFGPAKACGPAGRHRDKSG